MLVGCGGVGGGAEAGETHPVPPEQRQELNVTLDGWEGPETAGILMATENGYFNDGGLEVVSLVPATPGRSVRYVVDGTDVLGVAQEPQVVLAKEKGAPIAIIGSLVAQPTIAMIWTKKSGIGSVADLKGKTIAIPGLPFQRKFLEYVLAREGLTSADVTIEDVGYELVPALVSGRADAIFGGTWNLEGAELEARGEHPVITHAEDLGLPAYDELVVIARTERLSEEPRLARDFMSAVERGTAAAVEKPESLLDALAGAVEANPKISRSARVLQTDATLPLLTGETDVSSGQVESLVDWMYEQGMIKRKVPAAAFLTER